MAVSTLAASAEKPRLTCYLNAPLLTSWSGRASQEAVSGLVPLQSGVGFLWADIRQAWS